MATFSIFFGRAGRGDDGQEVARYKQRVALQQKAGHDIATARRLVVDVPDEHGKALRLPEHRRLAFHGRTDEPK